ncbi:MAG TPA: hypothetical protein VEL47_01775 [Myxococcota bacterium]|nr:hypothetical protein [Myxococcota bacterium]
MKRLYIVGLCSFLCAASHILVAMDAPPRISDKSTSTSKAKRRSPAYSNDETSRKKLKTDKRNHPALAPGVHALPSSLLSAPPPPRRNPVVQPRSAIVPTPGTVPLLSFFPKPISHEKQQLVSQDGTRNWQKIWHDRFRQKLSVPVTSTRDALADLFYDIFTDRPNTSALDREDQIAMYDGLLDAIETHVPESRFTKKVIENMRDIRRWERAGIEHKFDVNDLSLASSKIAAPSSTASRPDFMDWHTWFEENKQPEERNCAVKTLILVEDHRAEPKDLVVIFMELLKAMDRDWPNAAFRPAIEDALLLRKWQARGLELGRSLTDLET